MEKEGNEKGKRGCEKECEKEQIIHRKNGCGEKLMIWGN